MLLSLISTDILFMRMADNYIVIFTLFCGIVILMSLALVELMDVLLAVNTILQ